jgi:hypothetical protein
MKFESACKQNHRNSGVGRVIHPTRIAAQKIANRVPRGAGKGRVRKKCEVRIKNRATCEGAKCKVGWAFQIASSGRGGAALCPPCARWFPRFSAASSHAQARRTALRSKIFWASPNLGTQRAGRLEYIQPAVRNSHERYAPDSRYDLDQGTMLGFLGQDVRRRTRAPLPCVQPDRLQHFRDDARRGRDPCARKGRAPLRALLSPPGRHDPYRRLRQGHQAAKAPQSRDRTGCGSIAIRRRVWRIGKSRGVRIR